MICGGFGLLFGLGLLSTPAVAAPRCVSNSDCVVRVCCCKVKVMHRSKTWELCGRKCRCRAPHRIPRASCQHGTCVAVWPSSAGPMLSSVCQADLPLELLLPVDARQSKYPLIDR